MADAFGREQAGTLAGLLFALAGSMAALGPVVAGFIYDRAGDYQLAWWLSAGCNGLALLLLASFPGPGRALGGRSSGRLTPPAALAYSGAA